MTPGIFLAHAPWTLLGLPPDPRLSTLSFLPQLWRGQKGKDVPEEVYGMKKASLPDILVVVTDNLFQGGCHERIH